MATTSSLTAAENNVLTVSNLFKKTDYDITITENENKIANHDHDKYISTPEFNNLTSENFAARLKQTNLASKSDIANFANKTDFDNQ